MAAGQGRFVRCLFFLSLSRLVFLSFLPFPFRSLSSHLSNIQGHICGHVPLELCPLSVMFCVGGMIASIQHWVASLISFVQWALVWVGIFHYDHWRGWHWGSECIPRLIWDKGWSFSLQLFLLLKAWLRAAVETAFVHHGMVT